MAANITVKIRLGPMVYFQINGENCKEISHALEGHAELNEKLDALCSDLAERVYPEGLEQVMEDSMEDTL